MFTRAKKKKDLFIQRCITLVYVTCVTESRSRFTNAICNGSRSRRRHVSLQQGFQNSAPSSASFAVRRRTQSETVPARKKIFDGQQLVGHAHTRNLLQAWSLANTNALPSRKWFSRVAPPFSAASFKSARLVSCVYVVQIPRNKHIISAKSILQTARRRRRARVASTAACSCKIHERM